MAYDPNTLYVLLKPDGSVSAPNVFSAISRLSGHYGGHIVQQALRGAYHYSMADGWIAATQPAALSALLPTKENES